MAKYQKEFLVTYLRDISALHLALHKLQQQASDLENRKRSLEKGVQRGVCPQQPCYEASNGVFAMGLGVYLFMFSCSMFAFKLVWLACLCIVAGLLSLAIGLIRYVKVNQENARKEQRYNQKLSEYQEMQQKNEQERKALPDIQAELEKCLRQIQRTQDALSSVYRANVIPEHYQDLYTALFLYIWFESGKSTNLDMSRRILVDDQIKRKLDRFIDNKGESILKQYLHFSKKHGTPEGLKKHTASMVKKLAPLKIAKEEQKLYHEMIKSSAITIAYFASAGDAE